ncbi:MAG TPA: GNAT family N-acetyltransferase [Candidatus Kapabacteria bacterium]|nr:GNAT family N-acetyltransferase [Candidatus Kapabacteria bacterium]
MITVRRISSKQDKLRFIRFLWDVYRDDPNWVPPLEMDRMKLIDEVKNPFYKHSEVAWFLAEDDGKIVGRIAAIINRNHNEFHQDKTGFFGFFECINDLRVATALFHEAEGFLRSKGMMSVMGPENPSSNDEMGLLVKGFERPPVLLMTYNPKYYIDLIEANGYKKAKDLYAWLLSTATSRSEKLIRVTTELQQRAKITIRSFNKKQFDGEVSRIKHLYNQAWEKNWGFVPLSDEEFDFVAADLKQIYDPDMILFAEHNGETIGFALSLPDVNQAFAAGPSIPRGMMNLPIGLLNLFTKKKAIDTLRILILGIKKEYRGRGIDGMLYRETIERAERKGYKFGEASWILDDNDAMNRACEMMNGERYKTYRVYEKQL